MIVKNVGTSVKNVVLIGWNKNNVRERKNVRKIYNIRYKGEGRGEESRFAEQISYFLYAVQESKMWCIKSI